MGFADLDIHCLDNFSDVSFAGNAFIQMGFAELDIQCHDNFSYVTFAGNVITSKKPNKGNCSEKARLSFVIAG